MAIRCGEPHVERSTRDSLTPMAGVHTDDPVLDERASRERPTPELTRKLAVEFIGTFFLVFTLCTATNLKTGAGALAPLAIGPVLMVMVFAGGHISGGHHNPAVSTSVLVRGKLSSSDWIGYVLVQLSAAVIGGLLARAINGAGHETARTQHFEDSRRRVRIHLRARIRCPNVATAKATEGDAFYGLAIGFTVTAGAFAVGGLSGGAFNPAVALGASVLGIFTWSHYWIYVLATLLRGTVAARTFRYLQPSERYRGSRHSRTQIQGK
jgi:aquaporin Z